MKYSISIIFIFLCFTINAQYKSFQLLENGDTLNRIDDNNLKQGRWKIHINELRGEPGYDEEGNFLNNMKTGVWRIYDLYGLLKGKELYKWGNKNGLQQYLINGQVEREENWRAVDPDKKFDTIDVQDVYDHNKYEKKIIKINSYALPFGTWRYFDPESGRVIKTEDYNALGQIYTPIKNIEAPVADTLIKKLPKPKAVLDFEKSNKGKKSIKVRDGKTG